MWASARSTWLAVGPGCDSLLLGSLEQCSGPASNTLPRSAPAVLLIRRLPVASPSFQSHLTLVGWPVITGMPEHLFGKQGRPSPWTRSLLGIPPFFGLSATGFICLGFLVRPLTMSRGCQSEGGHETPFVNCCEIPLLIVKRVFSCHVPLLPSLNREDIEMFCGLVYKWKVKTPHLAHLLRIPA